MSALVEKLVGKSTQDNTDKCSLNPTACLGQVCFDGIVVVCMYAFLTYQVDKTWIDVDAALTFFSIWVPVLFLLKGLDLEYGDQLSRVAGWSLGNKLFAILTL
jgi:hypothetical protein